VVGFKRWRELGRRFTRGLRALKRSRAIGGLPPEGLIVVVNIQDAWIEGLVSVRS